MRTGDWRPERRLRGGVKRSLDVVGSGALLLVMLPLFAVIALAIQLGSPGPVFYRCRRVGRRGREFEMLKFRKMVDGAAGLPLTAADDERFTAIGRRLSRSKLDELPQLWNVLKGEMSLVGPRPEDPCFVRLWNGDARDVLSVRPGITGLSQLAFARESDVLDPNDRVDDYVRRLLPRKLALDALYARNWTPAMDARVLYWTVVAVVLRSEVAVNRETGRLGVRRRPRADHVLEVHQTEVEA